METYFIVVGVSTDNEQKYISNTAPVLWSDNRSDAKKFPNYQTAKAELEYNFVSLANIITYTNTKEIDICEIMINDNELRRERFL